MLLELRDAVTFFNLQGQPATLEELGIYTSKISLDGTFGIGHRADKRVKGRLNTPGAFCVTTRRRFPARLLPALSPPHAGLYPNAVG